MLVVCCYCMCMYTHMLRGIVSLRIITSTSTSTIINMCISIIIE